MTAPHAASSRLHAERLYETLGHELPCDESVRLLRSYAQAQRAPVVGAMRVTCSDEAEQETIQAFQRQFVRYLLPDLKFASKAPFRVANLGGRYPWGAVAVAEDHYASARGAEDWKLMVVKISSHVAVDEDMSDADFGLAPRYDQPASTYCGAISAVLSGSPLPFARQLHADLEFGGVERVRTLTDPARVSPEMRMLFAAALNARLQARRAMIDIQDHRPATPTRYLLQACVTINRRGHDTEIPIGIYASDRRNAATADEYTGIEDDPEAYELTSAVGRFSLRDGNETRTRPARDHRALIRDRVTEVTGVDLPRATREDADRARHLEAALSRAREALVRREVRGPLLKTLLGAAAAVAPVPAALLLFGEGLVHIHHANQAHRLAREAEGDPVARRMLNEIEGRVEALSPEEARHLTELLLRAYAR